MILSENSNYWVFHERTTGVGKKQRAPDLRCLGSKENEAKEMEILNEDLLDERWVIVDAIDIPLLASPRQPLHTNGGESMCQGIDVEDKFTPMNINTWRLFMNRTLLFFSCNFLLAEARKSFIELLGLQRFTKMPKNYL
ncbi:hypothetical protein CBL_09566 [Carabus blaptoides fortunei]